MSRLEAMETCGNLCSFQLYSKSYSLDVSSIVPGSFCHCQAAQSRPQTQAALCGLRYVLRNSSSSFKKYVANKNSIILDLELEIPLILA